MSLLNRHIIYFIGIGGIGMSALARYFLQQGKIVAGYDRTPSFITQELENQGAYIHYNEDVATIPLIVQTASNNDILVIYTPAVSSLSPLMQYVKNQNYTVLKRAEVLGIICNSYPTIAVAGTHGKTTISSLIAHIIHYAQHNCIAFLGGIVKNYQSNFIYNKNIFWAIAEADEYDRSFLQLAPSAAVITAIDPDHLDIYKTYDALKQAYSDFVTKIQPDGKLLLKKEIAFVPNVANLKLAFYSTNDNYADCTIQNIKIHNGFYVFDILTPWGNIYQIQPGITGDYNVENVLAAVSMCLWLGIDKDAIKEAVAQFKGVRRRFDVQVLNENHIYIDDYAHHPEEIKAFIQSVRKVFPHKRITGVFQPHLYSRTRDLANEFAKALSLLDELWLMDIYPARELPIEGVTSKIIFDQVNCPQKQIMPNNELLLYIKERKPELLLTMGAGNIDQFVEPIKRLMNEE
ncbi:MAG: UDP-N-acetylmuramate--L-alanine ligase [Bacteroidales bacterium]|nr:UDP-N-acetylmuramate--L-alanine ligase [Bacteroidales bacterium]